MRRVLVVDDDVQLRKSAARALEHHGFDVVTMPDGAAALEAARQQRPDVVVTDINMGGLDGYTLVTEMRADPDLKDVPVILMTGNADLAGLRRGMSAGADDYLPKPFSSSELVDAIGRRLERNAEARRPAEARLAELRASVTSLLPHELLTPLNGILGVAQLLAADADCIRPDDVRAYAEMLRVSGERLHRLVKNVLMYAHLDIVRHDPERKAGLVQGVAIESAMPVRRAAEREARAAGRLADLDCDLADVGLAIRADALDTIVGELVRNACEYSPKQTPIRVSLAVDATGTVAHLTVVDAGRGFPIGFAPRLGAFVQFERDRHEQQGAGLGLALVRRTAELFGGACAITSTPGCGATVRVSLRAIPVTSTTGAEARSA